MRFGLEDGSEHTLKKWATLFAVTRERIRQDRGESVAQAAPSVEITKPTLVY